MDSPNPKNSPLGPKKLKNWPQNWVKIKCQNWKKQRKWKLFNYMSRPKNSWPYSNHKTSPWGPQKDKNDPKIKSNSNVTIQGIIENESCSTTWVDPKTVFESHIEPEKSLLGPKKVKNKPKIKYQTSEWKETKKIKVVALYE